jgi:hypothetical protein
MTILKRIITMLQLLLILPPMLLQYLSDRKMGVMRYLVFKKDVFSKEIFTSSFTFISSCLLFLGIIFCIIFLLYSYTKKANNSLIKPVIGLFFSNLICLMYVFSYKSQTPLSYHFFLIAFFIIIILQYLKVFIISLYNKY